ncbi:MAG: ABC transporter substrate-binding protein [Alphaproteobacteria bacterium]|nr:ABC transporter substrate-binding protein [Rhizobiaceae bacterium]MBU3963207.1 ABC transporter substrate-binding protein [Alphaproteobacteria bacterium]MBU4048809.1 ABC transporter substrate-binding protein [Alphaproteobacteria bacterium]MBU4088221.1 ABC transporter substrate-binding protein [Alphaproteobacteria bacterium]MBU4158838.1 ABC transporter substrate-binding protein [Alphaproteobacteria bacterium]
MLRKLLSAAAMFAIAATGALAEGVDELNPDVAKRLYNKEMLDPMQPIGPSKWRDFKAKKGPPWKIGYASSYAGNTWRAAAMDELQKVIIPEWQKLGLLSEVVVTQSNLNDSTQIQQIRQLVDQGADAIILCCSNPTALNASVKYAADKGVPVFSMTGYLTSEYAINSSVNYQVGGYEIGKAMVDQLGGKGNVLVVEGIPGTSGSDSQNRGVLAGLASSPDIKVVGSVAGMWTDQVAQGEVQKWLATNPGKLDGIVVQSAAEMGVLRAVQQAGRGEIPVAIGGELGALCYWRKNPNYINASYQLWPAADDIELMWHIMMRTLQGQGPKIQSVLVDPVKLTYDDLAKIMDENCNLDSAEWLKVGAKRWGYDPSYLDDFFLHPADPRAYKP